MIGLPYPVWNGEKHSKTCQERDKYEIENDFFLVSGIRDSDWFFTLFPELLVDRHHEPEHRRCFDCQWRDNHSQTLSTKVHEGGGKAMKMEKVKIMLVLLGLLFGLMLLFGVGCHNIRVSPKNPEKPGVEKIPLDVGLYISDQFKNYKVSENRWGDQWNYTNLGEAGAAQFKLGLGLIFRTVEIVDEKPPFSKPKTVTLHAVIEPMIYKFIFDIPITKFQVYPAMIGYKITFYGMDGKVLFTKMVDGIGDTRGHPGFSFSENPTIAATKAVEDGINKALDAILASEEVKALVKEATK